MLSKTTILAYLGKDPEIKTVGTTTVTAASIAWTQSYKDRTGTKVEKSHWIEIEIWNTYGKLFAEHARNGDRVVIEGDLLTDSYDDKSGVRRKKVFIRVTSWHIVSKKSDRAPAPAHAAAPATGNGSIPQPQAQPQAQQQPVAQQKFPPQPSYATPSPLPQAQGFSGYNESEDDLPF
jgi:single-strand DNA-binding protein